MQTFAKFFEKAAPFRVKNFQTATRAALWELLATQIENKMPLLQALETAVKIRENTGQGNTVFTVALRAWSKGVSDGKKLADVIQPWVSAEEAMLIGAGEETGNLLVTLKSITQIMQAKQDIMSALSTLLYPVVLMVVLFGGLNAVGFQIVPVINTAVRNPHWEGWSKALIVLGEVAKVIYWPAMISTISIFVIVVATLDRFDGPIRVWLDRRAPYAIYRTVLGFSFLQSVAALVKAGITPLEAVRRLNVKKAPWLKRRLTAATRIMAEGKDIGVAFALAGHGFPDIEAVTLMAAYAEHHGFDGALQIIAQQWLTTAVKKIKKLSNGLLLISLLLVGSVVITILEGEFSLQGQFTDQLEQSMHTHR